MSARIECLDGPLHGSLFDVAEDLVAAQVITIKGKTSDGGFWEEHDYATTEDRNERGARFVRYTGDSWGMPR